MTSPLDADRRDSLPLSVAEARSLGEATLQRTGYPADEAIITDQLIDNALCGYRFACLLRILAIAEDERTAQDYGFLFIAIDSAILLPNFPGQMAELVACIRATPRQPGVAEVRIPSERAFREREQRRAEGIVLDRKVVDALNALTHVNRSSE